MSNIEWILIIITIFLVILLFRYQCHLDSVFYNENSISYSVMH